MRSFVYDSTLKACGDCISGRIATLCVAENLRLDYAAVNSRLRTMSLENLQLFKLRRICGQWPRRFKTTVDSAIDLPLSRSRMFLSGIQRLVFKGVISVIAEI